MAQPTRALTYSVLDVFTSENYKGNPLAVVYTDGDLSLHEYENIAREFGYSETSFIYYSEPQKALQVRSFSPTGFEVDGAGHNLLGAVAAALIKKMDIFREQDVAPFVIMKKAPIHVFIQTDAKTGLPVVKMLQRPAVVGDTVDTTLLAAALSIEIQDISAAHFSPSIVQTEVAHLMVNVNDTAILNRITPDSKALINISKQYGFEGFYCFALTADDDHIAEARFFNPLIGIEEDAATGTAAGPLAGILQLRQLIAIDNDYYILQGLQLRQPSMIEVRVTGDGILVGGTAVVTMEGQLYL
jgi:trans-2,3-dihydro-3-hydroxyanthranilate isomerase